MDDERDGQGLVVWITGLSGAGKTTVSPLVAARLKAADHPVLVLDGDALRAVFGDAHGHGHDDRRRLAFSYGRLCRMVAAQGIDVVCATVSMMDAVRDWNRANIPNYLEVYLRVPLPELEARDPKKIYAGARRGELRDVVGLDIPLEEPRHPDLVIDNHGTVSPDTAAAAVLDAIRARGRRV